MTEASKIEKANALAKEVFLANLGLAGKVFEQSQEMLKQTEAKLKETETKAKDAYSKRNEFFDGLVARGEKVQSDAVSKFESSKSEAIAKFKDTKAQALAKFEELKSESNTAVEAQLKTLRDGFEKAKSKVSRTSAEASEVVAEATAS